MARRGRWVAFALGLALVTSCAPKGAETTPPPRETKPPPRPILAEAGETCANDQGCVKGLVCRNGMCANPRSHRARTEGAIGIPACDTFLAMYRCWLARLPPAAVGPAGTALQRTREAWLRAVASGRPGTRRSIERGCQKAVNAFRRALSGNAKARGCLNP